MEIWLSNGVHDKIQLPINPESIGYTDNRNFEDVVLASGKEKTIIGGRNLRQYTITSYFAYNQPSFGQTKTALKPVDYITRIKGWMDNKIVIQLQATGTNINTPVTIRSFVWNENGGTIGDIDYTIELKEYDPITFSLISPVSTVKSSPRPPSRKAANLPRTYIVRKNDNLWNISKKYYGTPTKWTTIYNKNKAVIGRNSNLIIPGQKLVIP